MLILILNTISILEKISLNIKNCASEKKFNEIQGQRQLSTIDSSTDEERCEGVFSL